MDKPSAKATVAMEKEAVATAARSAAATAGARAKDLAAKAAEAAAVSAAATAAAAKGFDSNPAMANPPSTMGGADATAVNPSIETGRSGSATQQKRSTAGGKTSSNKGSKRSAASVDDAYAVAMGAGGEDAAESAQWMEAAQEQKLPTVGIDLVSTHLCILHKQLSLRKSCFS